MIVAAPGITDEEKAAITDDITAMATSDTWQEALANLAWVDTFLTGDALDAQLANDIEATEAILRDIGLVQ